MCGIAGIIDLKKQGRIKADYLENMARLLRHRGPDEKNYFSSRDKNTALLNTRLSIIDLKTGTQPIFNEKKDVCAVLNGEIYNYKELTARLIKKGHRFSTHSDTEAIVHLYEEKGQGFPEALDGMFAIFLWDFKENKGFLCRDRLGKKPLYYYTDKDWFVAASELNAILKSGIENLDFKMDFDSLNQFFTFGMTVGRHSIIKNIRKLPPATVVEFDYKNGLSKERKYWQIPLLERGGSRDFDKAVREFGGLFEESVKKRFVSDVKIGAFLSGGVDSTAVVAAAKRLGYDVDTYTVGFSKSGFDESGYAARIAGILGMKNKSIILDKEITKEDVVDIMSRFDEPFYDHSGIPTYFLSKMVSSELKVVISGDGGDENLMGYNHYDNYYFYPEFLMKRLSPALVDKLNRVKLMFWDRLFTARFTRVKPYYLKRLFENPPKSRSRDLSPFLRRYRNKDFFDVVSKLDLNLYLVDDILVKVDRMSMQNSLEVRCPFLDYKLVEHLAGIHSSLKRGYSNNKKAILKEYLKRSVDSPSEVFEIINRRKHGFRFPIGRYVDELKKEIYEWLKDREFIEYFSFKKDIIEEMLADSFDRKDRRKVGKSLWHLLCLYWWWAKSRDVLT